MDFCFSVLKDGRVFVAGGEYNAGQHVDLLAAEIYDPIADSWSAIGTPSGWQHIGDAPSCVLPDDRVLLSSIMETQDSRSLPTEWATPSSLESSDHISARQH